MRTLATWASLACAAGLATLYAGGAAAGDLGKGPGGSCCSDLEERVAELEATVTKKGNRKVSLTVYGQVNWAILHFDADGLGLNETTLTNNSNSVTRFGFKGEAKITADWSAGYLLEIGIGEARPALEFDLFPPGVGLGSDGTLRNALTIRHSAVYMEHKSLGTIWLGQTGTATDGIAEISLARVANASTLLSLEPVSGAWLGGINLPFDGGRTEVVKWVSPTLAGFTLSAAWFANDNDAWDVALRYSGEFAGFRVAAGVGYRNETSPVAGFLPPTVDDEVTTLAGSASLMHLSTGLFANVAAGKVDGWAANGVALSIPLLGLSFPFPFVDVKAVHVQGGIEKNWFGIGATTLYGEWGRFEDSLLIGDAVEFWGLGINQAVDAAAMDLYLGYRSYDELDASAAVAGAIIRF